MTIHYDILVVSLMQHDYMELLSLKADIICDNVTEY